ncbi:unnamed protein product, partial [Leptidea sinapis]
LHRAASPAACDPHQHQQRRPSRGGQRAHERSGAGAVCDAAALQTYARPRRVGDGTTLRTLPPARRRTSLHDGRYGVGRRSGRETAAEPATPGLHEVITYTCILRRLNL